MIHLSPNAQDSIRKLLTEVLLNTISSKLADKFEVLTSAHLTKVNPRVFDPEVAWLGWEYKCKLGSEWLRRKVLQGLGFKA